MDKIMIDVIVDGGLVQEVIGVPKGVVLRVIDYDIEGGQEPDDLIISPYDKDQKCYITLYDHEDTPSHPDGKD